MYIFLHFAKTSAYAESRAILNRLQITLTCTSPHYAADKFLQVEGKNFSLSVSKEALDAAKLLPADSPFPRNTTARLLKKALQIHAP